MCIGLLSRIKFQNSLSAFSQAASVFTYKMDVTAMAADLTDI